MNKCLKCNYEWEQRKKTKPKECPNCKTRIWDNEKHSNSDRVGKINKCNCCGHSWKQRGELPPIECPSCQNRKWSKLNDSAV